MNILQFICPTGFYGAEMWILALARHLDSARVNCRLAVTRESETQNLEICTRFKKLDLPCHVIDMKGRFDPQAILKLCRLIRGQKIDIIHTHGYKSDILGLMAARLSGIKSLATPHGFENVKDLKLQLFIKLGCMALRRFDRVAPLSPDLVADMHRIRVAPDKIHPIINGVDLDEIRSATLPEAPDGLKAPNEKIIGYVGQIAYRKNIGDMIKAFDLLYQDHKHVSLILVGDGPMRKELEESASRLSSSANIQFLGYRPDRLNIMKKMDVFCMTSFLEGIPRSMMEAMAMGVPAAAYDIPGVDRLIINGETGLSVKLGDVTALKKCWEKLLFDNAYAAKIAENGRAYVEKKYSAGRMAQEYTALYREMLTKG